MSRTYFFWDPLSDNILQERDETGAVTAEYTTEQGLYGNVISQNRGGVEKQYHFDPQGSTLALTDDNQQLTDTYGYTAFGGVTERTGSTVNPFQYIGQKGYYFDTETEECYVRRRLLSSKQERWNSSDPLDGRMSGNRFVYARNTPLLSFDPSGMITIRPICEDKVFTIHGLGCQSAASRARYIFELDKKAECPGYIIQHITALCVVQPCAKCPVPSGSELSTEFWEAWEVDPKIDPLHERCHSDNGFTDNSKVPIRNNFCGSAFIVGDVKFFCKDDIGDLEAQGWKRNKTYGSSVYCEYEPGNILSIGFIKPKWWDNPGRDGFARRSHQVVYNCCKSTDPDKFCGVLSSATPDPRNSGTPGPRELDTAFPRDPRDSPSCVTLAPKEKTSTCQS